MSVVAVALLLNGRLWKNNRAMEINESSAYSNKLIPRRGYEIKTKSAGKLRKYIKIFFFFYFFVLERF